MVHNGNQLQLRTGCHAPIDGILPTYGYFPSEAAGITFVILFSISTIAHIFQSVKSRQFWYLTFAIGGVSELIGWGGRLWSSQCPYNNTAFLMQISTLIFAPAFFTAGTYYTLKQIIDVVGPQYSLIKPKFYLWIFISVDIISLTIQAVGGGMASAASNQVGGNTKPGTNIMVAGIIFQMASITVFCVLYGLFLFKSRQAPAIPSTVKWVTIATVISITVIYIRSIYRTIELLQGWTGYLITHEVFFIILDGAMMVIAVSVYNIINPATLLSKTDKQTVVDLTSDEEAVKHQ